MICFWVSSFCFVVKFVICIYGGGGIMVEVENGFFLLIGNGIFLGGVGNVKKDDWGWFGMVMLFVFFDGIVLVVCFWIIFLWLYMLFKSKGLNLLVMGWLGGRGFEMLFVDVIKVSFYFVLLDFVVLNFWRVFWWFLELLKFF